MGVLSRTKNESIAIDGNIEIRVLEIRGNRFRLSIEAPSNIQMTISESKSSEGESVSDENASTASPSLNVY